MQGLPSNLSQRLLARLLRDQSRPGRTVELPGSERGASGLFLLVRSPRMSSESESMSARFSEAVLDEILRRLGEGESLRTICAGEGMPHRDTVRGWARADPDLAQRIEEAREEGYQLLAERAFEEARTCVDPIKGRLAFDAARWYLGKLSRAFAERPVAIGVQVNADCSDAFAAIAGALQDAAAARASLAHRTSAVVVEGEARSIDAPRQLADLAGDGGARLGQDACGG